MCVFSSAPSMPMPEPVPEPADPPKATDPGVKQARNDERSRIRQLAGLSSLTFTSPGGIMAPANLNLKQLTGV